MKAERGIRILAQLFEVKTGLQERALSSPAKTRNFCMTEIKGIDKAIEIVRMARHIHDAGQKVNGARKTRRVEKVGD